MSGGNYAPSMANDGAAAKPVLGVFFVTCNVYGRLHKNQRGVAYEGRCPRCGKPCKIAIGAGGSDTRFFRAFCR
jgi:hypothetical protein